MSVEFCWETEMKGEIINFDPKLKEGLTITLISML